MWDTVVEISTHLTHDPPCPRCGHGEHLFLACDHCACSGPMSPAAAASDANREPAPAP